MAQVSRTALFAKLHKVLKKHYKPVALDAKRTVLEHLLFACVLEDASYEAAETALAALTHTFFDWNEVRVTSIAELAEVLAGLPDPRAAALRVKRVLHGVFEATYSFDLEEKRKKGLGTAQKWFEKLDGISPFAVAYLTQAALAGHAIPLDAGTMQVMRILDLANEKDAAAFAVPGLERAVPKSKGAEFASLLHQLGAELTANPFGAKIRDMLLEISPASSERLPKRRVPKPAVAEQQDGKAAASAKKAETPAKKADGAAKKHDEPTKKAAEHAKTPPAKQPAVEKRPVKSAPPAPEKTKKLEKPAEKAAAKPVAKPIAKPAPGKPAPASKKKSAVTLTKKKPR